MCWAYFFKVKIDFEKIPIDYLHWSLYNYYNIENNQGKLWGRKVSKKNLFCAKKLSFSKCICKKVNVEELIPLIWDTALIISSQKFLYEAECNHWKENSNQFVAVHFLQFIAIERELWASIGGEKHKFQKLIYPDRTLNSSTTKNKPLQKKKFWKRYRMSTTSLTTWSLSWGNWRWARHIWTYCFRYLWFNKSNAFWQCRCDW